MPKHIRNRFIVLAVLILAGLVCSAPSFFGVLPSWWQKILPTNGMRLGLDLQGGMYLILKVDIPRAVQHHLDVAANDLRDALRRQHIGSAPPESAGPGQVRLRVRSADVAAVKRIVQDDFPDLDLAAQGDDFVELKLKQSEIKNIQSNTVDQSLEILRNRIDQFGVQEPVIVRQGSDEIVLQLAGITNPQRAMDIVGRTAQLEFKLVAKAQVPDLDEKLGQAIRSGRLKPNFSHQELNQAFKNVIPEGTEVYVEKHVDRQTGRVTTFPVLLQKNTLMTGEALKTARVEIGGRYGQPSVGLTFNDRGARLFERITRDNVGRQLAIILDDIVQSAPVIEEPISGGNAQINGNFSAAEAHDLAIVLRAGALPAPVNVVQNMTVGPSLGRDSIHKGLSSTILGAVLVLIFMVVYYRISGLIANFALLLNLLLMIAALSLFRATLTLPGIAGIVLSIGMAVDSNVLIFERMREELALSKPVYSSVQGGYDKALWTIIDAHVTTLITALALFLFGTGPIKGFAVTLSIGVLLNLFTALFGTRVVYDYLHFKHRLKSFQFLHILSRPNIDFIRMRKAAFIFSGALVALGLFSVLQIERGKANLGVELGGGAMIQFQAQKDFRLDQVRAALTRAHLSDYELQEVPGEKVLIVRVKKTHQTAGTVASQVSGVLNKSLANNHFTIQSQAEIGSSVSKDLKHAALIAIAISFAGIIIYLAWRFDRRFGVAAAIATFHDVLTVLGIFYLLNKEITLLVVTALLTLAGYSLTDTVVVFDRIRENLRLDRRQPLAATIDQSINQVLSRTVITSGTVLLVLIALLLMGGVILHDFALALLIGVVIGTYSSIFVASPIVYMWDVWRKKARTSKGVDKSRG
jgi:SecD/SecF fusion protein